MVSKKGKNGSGEYSEGMIPQIIEIGFHKIKNSLSPNTTNPLTRITLMLYVVKNIMKESLRYLNNAKEILKSVSVEDNTYIDVKPVREAFGTAYLAVLEAINEYLITKKGLTKKELPKSVDAYRKALQRYIAVHNGRLLREFEMLYDTLHIAGYYRGLLYNTEIVKDALRAAKNFIEKIG